VFLADVEDIEKFRLEGKVFVLGFEFSPWSRKNFAYFRQIVRRGGIGLCSGSSEFLGHDGFAAKGSD